MEKKDKTATGAKSNAAVDVKVAVHGDGRHVTLEADDPAQPGKKMTRTVTVGDDHGRVSDQMLAMGDAAFDAKVQADVDAAAAAFADEVESRRRVHAALGKIS